MQTDWNLQPTPWGPLPVKGHQIVHSGESDRLLPLCWPDINCRHPQGGARHHFSNKQILKRGREKRAYTPVALSVAGRISSSVLPKRVWAVNHNILYSVNCCTRITGAKFREYQRIMVQTGSIKICGKDKCKIVFFRKKTFMVDWVWVSVFFNK